VAYLCFFISVLLNIKRDLKQAGYIYMFLIFINQKKSTSWDWGLVVVVCF